MAGHFVVAQADSSNSEGSPKGSPPMSSITPIIIPAMPATPLPRLAVEPDAPRVSRAISQKSQGPQDPGPSKGPQAPDPSSRIDERSTPEVGAIDGPQKAQLPTPPTEQAAQPETARPADLPPGIIEWPARNFTTGSGPGDLAPPPSIPEPGEGQAQSGSTGGGPAEALPVPTAGQGVVSVETSPAPETNSALESKSALQTTESLEASEPLPSQKIKAGDPKRLGEDPTPDNTQPPPNVQPTEPQTTNPKQPTPNPANPPPTKVWAVITNLFFSIFGFNP